MSGLAHRHVQGLGNPARTVRAWYFGLAISLAVAGWLSGHSPGIAVMVVFATNLLLVVDSHRSRSGARLSALQFVAGQGFSAVVDGRERVALLARGTSILPWAVFASLECPSQGKTRFSVMFTSASAGADTFRRLRVGLLNDHAGNPA